jgi:hypothetical protein
MMKSSVSSLAEILVKLDRLLPRAVVVNQEDIARVQVHIFSFFFTFGSGSLVTLIFSFLERPTFPFFSQYFGMLHF